MTASPSSFDIAGIALGVREAVILLIALVVVYMVVVLWRMRRLRGKGKAEKESPTPGRASPTLTAVVGDEEDEEDAGFGVPESNRARTADSWSPPPGMAEEMVQGALEQEIAILRDEVDALRGELAALREDMRHELGQMRASQSISPIYGDAMQLAQAGYDPAAIAERCGIARAEAELVVALAKSQEQ